MQSLDLNLVIFSSTKGHFDHDTYDISLKDLYNKIPLELFENKYVSIKISDGQNEKAAKMAAFYQSYGFVVAAQKGEWSHFSESHMSEYMRDIKNMYLDVVDADTKYSLHLEDDFLFNPANGEQLSRYIARSMIYLDNNKNIMAVRFPRFHNEVERLNGLKVKHGLNVSCEQDQNNKLFYKHNDNLSLNPTIFRTSDIRAAARLAEINPSVQHVEHHFTGCLSIFSRDKYPYAIIDPKEINVLHIGTRLGEEDKANEQLISG